jgi:glycogen debranching enzyme
MASAKSEDATTSSHVLTTASFADERSRVLKHGDTFAVFDHHGRIKAGGLGEEGLYHDGTRFLSRLVMELEGKPLIVLSSTVSRENGHLAVALTNPDLIEAGKTLLPFGTLHIAMKTFLWKSVCYQQIHVKNYGQHTVRAEFSIHFSADYADIFEIRGMKRKARGTDLDPEVIEDTVVLGYRGLDNVVRQTAICFSPVPAQLSSATAHFNHILHAGEETRHVITVTCRNELPSIRTLSFEIAQHDSQAEAERYRAWACHLETSNGQINAWLDRATSDLQLMTTELPTGPYPYAGVPWFNTPFGRDGILTALECLWLRPSLARGVLAYLASTQAVDVIPSQDAEPGKILHEIRFGEMAALGEMPFGRYYGSVDATPLFVLLAGAYYQRTGDLEFVRSLWPNIAAALGWIDSFGDRSGRGFVEYRQSKNGLLHQGWKDSDDAIFHADGTPAVGPIALCEVQAYVYAARRAAATVATALGQTDCAADLVRKAQALQRNFESAFWCEDLSTYAVALDGQGRPCRVRTSNAGHCLFAGIADPDRARRLARTLLSAESFSGWGVRTVAASEVRYNPMGYHTGSVWPHDNALIASGLARYGYGEKALQILTGQFQAGTHFELHRMPELFCGFAHYRGESPVLYPVACAPQAWSAASVFLLVQACLGLEISGVERQLYFTRPQLPASLGELRIHNLEVAGSTIDLLLEKQEHKVEVNVIRRGGDIQVMVIK